MPAGNMSVEQVLVLMQVILDSDKCPCCRRSGKLIKSQESREFHAQVGCLACDTWFCPPMLREKT